jgi:hypothetical protein
MKNAEQIRLEEAEKGTIWKKFGPYLSERQWGTVREDYSEFGSAWEFFPHDHARSRAYRWGEDGIAGISDDKQLLCFSLALWNENDPILKERLFGLTGNQGNHSEDVKELYYYLDNTPTHSYMRYLYKYPHNEFPYQQLVVENEKRGKNDTEFEIADTGIFSEDAYFDIFISYAKYDEESLFIEVEAHNRGKKPAKLHLLPTFWYRNTWSWSEKEELPSIKLTGEKLTTHHHLVGEYEILFENQPKILFTENETNATKLFGLDSKTFHVKDAFHEYLIYNKMEAVNPDLKGTKCAIHYDLEIKQHASQKIRLILKKKSHKHSNSFLGFGDFNSIMQKRKFESDEFYEHLAKGLSPEQKNIQKQALAGMLWGKQFYNFNVNQWLEGDKGQYPPPEIRKKGRNYQWRHLDNHDIISMPDKWEYPWYAAWDLAFHCIPLALVDTHFAKQQLELFVSDRYMNLLGQIPAYEWAFGDVNPPVHAFGTWKVYLKDKEKNNGVGDKHFLMFVFQKLQLNFQWWMHTQKMKNSFIFGGGFLGLDNVGVLDRGAPLPDGAWLEQLDATSWMALYALDMTKIALELSNEYPPMEDEAIYFTKVFLQISSDMNGSETGFWSEEKQMYFEKKICYPNGKIIRVDLLNIVSIMPLMAATFLDATLLKGKDKYLSALKVELFNHKSFAEYISIAKNGDVLLSVLNERKLKSLTDLIFDETQFLSPFGIRSMSKKYEKEPFEIEINGQKHYLRYRAAESDTENFGENSNWRGPIWFPTNYVLIDAIIQIGSFYKNEFKCNFPSFPFGVEKNLLEIANDISERLSSIFILTTDLKLPLYQTHHSLFQNEHFSKYLLFYEFFNAETGSGVGASHQTGWTGLVADLMYRNEKSQK